MSEPMFVAIQRASLAIADLQDDLAKVWDDSVGRWVGPSKFPEWAAERRSIAYEVIAQYERGTTEEQ